MKKLESLKNSKFELSQVDLTSIRGGYESGYSWEYSTTQMDGQAPQTDVKAWDICWDL